MNRDFKGVWIPALVWIDGSLTPLEKCLYVEIDSLDCSKDHCYASNEYFAEFLQCSVPTISRALTKLSNLNRITIEYKTVPWGKQRVITVLIKMINTPNQNDDTPPNQNDEHINIRDINNINNNTRSTKVLFIKPSLEEIKEYCKEKKCKTDPEYFWNYWEARDWVMKDGKKVLHWRNNLATFEKNSFSGAPVVQESTEDQLKRLGLIE